MFDWLYVWVWEMSCWCPIVTILHTTWQNGFLDHCRQKKSCSKKKLVKQGGRMTVERCDCGQCVVCLDWCDVIQRSLAQRTRKDCEEWWSTYVMRMEFACVTNDRSCTIDLWFKIYPYVLRRNWGLLAAECCDGSVPSPKLWARPEPWDRRASATLHKEGSFTARIIRHKLTSTSHTGFWC